LQVQPGSGLTPQSVSRRVRVPEHDLVEKDHLGLRAPVTIYAEPRLCVDEGRAVAAGAVATFGLVRAVFVVSFAGMLGPGE
jgi:hypothetical protein